MEQKDNVIFKMRHRRVFSVSQIQNMKEPENKENENTFEYEELI